MPNSMLENANPKRNPWTSIPGFMFFLLSLVMATTKYILPFWFVPKQDLTYQGWHILVVVGVGIILIFINESYFAKIFNRADRIVAKRTETPEKIVEEIKIEKKTQ